MRPVLLFAGVLAAALLGVGHADGAESADRDLTWRVDAKPFRLTVFEHGRVLVRQRVGRAGAGTRLSYRLREDGSMQTLTNLITATGAPNGTVYTVATTEPDRAATVTVSRTGRGLRVSVALGASEVAVRTVYEAFEAAPGEHYLGAAEQHDHVDLSGTIVPLKVWHQCGTAKSAPFYLSSRGYGIRFATSAVGRAAFGRVDEAHGCQLGTSPCEVASRISAVQACFKTSTLSYEIYAGRPDQVVRAYMASVGRQPLPDPEAFAVAKWREQLAGAADLTEDADRFRAAGIPLGWVIVDNPWEAGLCAGSLKFDPTLFPDPEGTIAGLHTRGIRVMMWISPSLRVPCGLGLYPAERTLGPGSYRALDLTDPTVLTAFEERLRDLLATGIDGFKADRGDDVDLELHQLAGGRGDDLHNQYPLLYARAIAQATEQARGRSVPTMFRAGFAGSQRLAAGSWSGDLRGSWDGLENAVRSAQTAGVLGYSTWGSDIGGYFSGSLTPDVFVRWAQLGAVSPIFEVGGDGLNSTPWVLGDKAMAGLRTAAILHYELFPYHYELARRASATGLSILRPLALQYPDDERSWDAEYEMLVGTDLLAAPVTHPGSVADVYLPPGRWVDVSSGAGRTGPVSLRRTTPLDELPLYLREGAAVPFNLRDPDVWQARWQLNDLFRQGRGGWLVAPGSDGAASGTSVDYGSLRTSGTASQTRLQLSHARAETQVVLLGKRFPARVTIDGRLVTKSGSAAALRGERQGWLVQSPPFAGVVLKLRPQSGRSLVVVQY